MRLSDLDLLPRRVYAFRILGFSLVGLPIAVSLWELSAPQGLWWAWAASSLLWPHLAWLRARRSAAPFLAERTNLLIDSAIAGMWVPLIDFNLLPSVLLMAVVTADKINTGIRSLWLHSLVWLGAGLLFTGGVKILLLGGLGFHPTTTAAIVACLPVLVVHTLATSLYSYSLVRKVQQQNRKLESLSRTDTLTSAFTRRHWEHQAQQILSQARTGSTPATLMLVDLDHFKAINDAHGHAVGDDVLQGISQLLRDVAGDKGSVGRYGGDEFAITLNCTASDATLMAGALRAKVDALRFDTCPGLRTSISVGLAEADAGTRDLRAWIVAADRALYRAKHQGRNRIEIDSAPTPSDAPVTGVPINRGHAAHCPGDYREPH